MPSVKILHYTHKVNSNGTSPVIIQVIDGKPKKRTLANVFTYQWDDDKKRVIPKSHPNYAVINIKISNEYNRLEALILSNRFNMQRDFIAYFKNLKSGNEGTGQTKKTFSEIVPLYISSLKSGSSMVSYESKINYFIENASIPPTLLLSEITKTHLDKFVRFMTDKGNKESTMRANLKLIRYVASFAKREGYDIASDYFMSYKLPPAGRSSKSKLTRDELFAFSKVPLTADSKMREMQDMFMLAVYLRGMRIGDVIILKEEYFSNGRIVYRSGKNKKYFNIKLVAEATAIVERNLTGSEYLFSFYTWQYDKLKSAEQNKKDEANHIKDITAHINRKLKIIAERAGITKNISTHIARHTFAKMAIDQIKDSNITMDLVGHSSIKEHETYIREISQDDELDAAVDLIFKK